jgi:hypothetical protein
MIRKAEATAFDWLMHCLALTWKIIFLIVTCSKTLAEREGGHSFFGLLIPKTIGRSSGRIQSRNWGFNHQTPSDSSMLAS